MLNCEASSLAVFTVMGPKEQQTSDILIVKNNCFIIEIFDKCSFNGILKVVDSCWISLTEWSDTSRSFLCMERSKNQEKKYNRAKKCHLPEEV